MTTAEAADRGGTGAASPGSVATKSVQGAAWNLGAGLGVRILGLAGTLVLTRFIAPGEYGEVALASIFVLSASMFTNLSFGHYVIAKRSGPDVSSQAAVYHVLLGIVGVVAVIAFGDRLGIAVHAPGIDRFVPGLALAALIERVGYIPERLLLRDLRFRQVAIAKAVGEIAFTATSIALAISWGGYGIVAGNLVRASIVTTLVASAVRRSEWLKPGPFRWSTARDLLAFCVPLMLATLAEYASTRWDKPLLGRFYGPEIAGLFTMAYNLAETPGGQVGEALADVLLPSFARLPVADRRRGLIRAAGLMTLVIAPLALGLGAVATTLVRTFFDERWAMVGPMLAVLSVISLIRAVNQTLSAFLQAQQRPRSLMILAFVKGALILSCIPLLAGFGVLWACVGVGAGYLLHMLVALFVAGRIEGVPVLGFIRAVAPPLLASAPMVLGVIGARMGLAAAGVRPGTLALGIEIAAGAVVYVGAAFAIAGGHARDFLGLLAKLRGREPRTA